MADITPETLERVRALASIHLVLSPDNSVPLRHWCSDPHYPGYECLSFAERSFGRALRLWLALTRHENEPLKVGLSERPEGYVWDCYTPNRDTSESHHIIYEYTDKPWVVNKVEHLPSGLTREVASPFSVWANLDATPRWESDRKPANLVALNADRMHDGRPPFVVALHADDKHALLLQLMEHVQFTCMRRGALEIHPSALREMAYGFITEGNDWIPQAEWDARTASQPDDDNPFDAGGTPASAPATADDNPFGA